MPSETTDNVFKKFSWALGKHNILISIKDDTISFTAYSVTRTCMLIHHLEYNDIQLIAIIKPIVVFIDQSTDNGLPFRNKQKHRNIFSLATRYLKSFRFLNKYATFVLKNIPFNV